MIYLYEISGISKSTVTESIHQWLPRATEVECKWGRVVTNRGNDKKQSSKIECGNGSTNMCIY